MLDATATATAFPSSFTSERSENEFAPEAAATAERIDILKHSLVLKDALVLQASSPVLFYKKKAAYFFKTRCMTTDFAPTIGRFKDTTTVSSSSTWRACAIETKRCLSILSRSGERETPP